MFELRTSEFFIVRSPRLAIDLLRVVPHDEESLITFLSDWLESPLVREALYIASPSFFCRAQEWLENPKSKDTGKFINSLLKYFVRMTSRATPFGLFAGVSVGSISDVTLLSCRPAEEDRRVTRIDMGFLNALQDRALSEADPSKVQYFPNQSLHEVGSTFHYIEPYFSRGCRNYRLNSVHVEDPLRFIISRARVGATWSELLEAVRDEYPGTDICAIKSYLDDLINESILIRRFPVSLTGRSPEESFILSANDVGAVNVACSLSMCVENIRAIDANGFGKIGAYTDVSETLSSLFPQGQTKSFFHCDLFRRFEVCTLSRADVSSLTRVISILATSKTQRIHALSEFAVRFTERYEAEMVPLLIALNEEIGIPFFGGVKYQSKLLAGLRFGSVEPILDAPDNSALTQLQNYIANRILENPEPQGDQLDLDFDEVPSEIVSGGPSLPFSFSALVSVFQDREEGRASKAIFHLKGCFGPSSANLIGRFCHLDSGLLTSVRDELQKEAEHSPHVIFAEIVHFPDGRPGNIIARPHLRNYEIVFFGDSNLPGERQIPVSDLYVYVEGGVVKLWSKQLNAQVIPRLSCAHNYGYNSLGIYKFLCSLGAQEANLPTFELPKILQKLSVSPRVTIGNVIVQEKQWRIKRSALESLVDGVRWKLGAWNSLSAQFRLDRFVTWSMGDNVLTVDLHNPFSIRMLLGEVGEANEVVLKESLATVYDPVVHLADSKGAPMRFVNEVVIPFTYEGAPHHPTEPGRSERLVATKVRRRFAPGSEWLTLKIYGSPSIIDDLLVDTLLPFAQDAFASGAASRWFYIRYGDPDWHIRLRFNGSPSLLNGECLPKLVRMLGGRIESGEIKRIESATYTREVERYGGNEGVLIAEDLFHAECTFLARTLPLFSGSCEQHRWMLATSACLEVLASFGVNGHEAQAIMDRLRAGFGREFRENRMLRNALGEKYKAFRVYDFLDNPKAVSWGDIGVSLQNYLSEFGRSISPIADRYEALRVNGRLICSKDDLIGSIAHMINNRIFKYDNRRHEFVVYDFLRRFLVARAARNVYANKSESMLLERNVSGSRKHST
ncbi:MAG TPA: hypothetical protein DDZ76_00345 [Xanthomonadales bacterium]|nr:hypothetical protein [Xanthomonadales bacterium]